MKKYLFLLLLGLLPFFSIIGQSKIDTVSQKKPLLQKSSFIVLPLIFYSPETRLGGGIASIFAFRFRGNDEKTKPSQVQLGFAYTQEKQILAYLPFQLYFKNETWFAYGDLGYYRYIYQFFGIGNDTKLNNQEPYDANYPRLRLNILRKITPKMYVGGRLWYDDYKVEGKKTGGILVTENIAGNNGGIIAGIGLVANRDSRDQVFYPTKGNFTDIVLYTNQKSFGSDFNFTRFSIDATQYFSINSKAIFATNVFADFVFGTPPFQQLALIGGSKKMRGFFEGRYRDKKLWLIQAEYRQWIYKFIGATLFASTGSVAPDFKDFTNRKIHVAFGAGLRIRLSKKDNINLRLDAGFNEDFNFRPYLTVGEAF